MPVSRFGILFTLLTDSALSTRVYRFRVIYLPYGPIPRFVFNTV